MARKSPFSRFKDKKEGGMVEEPMSEARAEHAALGKKPPKKKGKK